MISTQIHKKGNGYPNLEMELTKILTFTCPEFQISFNRITHLPHSSSIIDLSILVLDGAYQSILFKPSIYIGKNYPIKQPLIYSNEFTPHPNINQLTKQVVLLFLVEWNPTNFVSDVVYHLARTLAVPRLEAIPYNNLNMEVSSDYIHRKNRKRFYEMIGNWKVRKGEVKMESEGDIAGQESRNGQYEYGPTKILDFDFKAKDTHAKRVERLNFSMEKLILELDFVRIRPRPGEEQEQMKIQSK